MTKLIPFHSISMNFERIDLEYSQALSMKEIGLEDFLFSSRASLQIVLTNIQQSIGQISLF